MLKRALAVTALMLGGCCGMGMSASAASAACRGDNGGLRLSPGWCATVFADKLGHVRHMVVAPTGVLYVNTWSGVYYDNDKPPAGGFLIALKDSKGTGRADIVKRFGDGVAQGSAGGTGIGFYNGAIYAEENDKIVRFALPKDALVPDGPYQVVLTGMPTTGDHPMHPFIIDAQGNIFIDLGSPTNSCQAQNRMLESPGIKPCKELETRAGIWRYERRQAGPDILACRALCDGHSQRRGFRLRRGRAGSSSRNTAATSSGRTGRSSIPRKPAPNCRQRNSSNSPSMPISAGRNVISTAIRGSSCSRRNMAAMAAGRRRLRARKRVRSLSFPRIGRRTIF